jgi:hypothetical protein
MPVSDVSNIAPILNEVVRINPEGLIELGVGFGKYGALCREVLDAVHGRCRPDQWEHRIFGLEGFMKYNNPVWGAYDQVFQGDFAQCADGIKGWPLVMMIDSLEHLEKAEAQTLLHQLVENNERVIISVPVGNCPQDGVFGNDYEKHRSTWSGPGEFSAYNYRVLHQGVCCVVSIKGVK